MNGVINVYKESGMTSFRVVAAIRAITGEKKAGHLGTLDPDAEGVLPVCLGKATKLMGLISDNQKEYLAVIQLGISTDTQDISGTVLNRRDPDIYTESEIQDALDHFTGDIMQLPPMYSALKVGGVKLVDAARKGIEIERKARKITIFGYSDIAYDQAKSRISFTVRCSSGTYIRTLCQDIGAYLGVPACMLSLIRSETAGLRLENAITLDKVRQIEEAGHLEDIIIPTEQMIKDSISMISRSSSADKKLLSGNILYSEDIRHTDNEYACENIEDGCRVLIYDSNQVFTALYRYDAAQNYFKCEKMLR